MRQKRFETAHGDTNPRTVPPKTINPGLIGWRSGTTSEAG
jgi:hypothetical protein